MPPPDWSVTLTFRVANCCAEMSAVRKNASAANSIVRRNRLRLIDSPQVGISNDRDQHPETGRTLLRIAREGNTAKILWTVFEWTVTVCMQSHSEPRGESDGICRDEADVSSRRSGQSAAKPVFQYDSRVARSGAGVLANLASVCVSSGDDGASCALHARADARSCSADDRTTRADRGVHFVSQ